MPCGWVLSGGILWRYACTMHPRARSHAFCRVIFAGSFRNATNPNLAFGSNIVGSVLGGLAESFSMLLGFQHLLLLAMLFYVLSAWSPSPAAGKRLILLRCQRGPLLIICKQSDYF